MFAVLFAIGAERLFRILDAALEPMLATTHEIVPSPATGTAWYFDAGLLIPVVMTLATLYVGVLASLANEIFVDRHPQESARSPMALLAYASLLCVLFMFYVAADRALTWHWWLGYAALCLVNAAWNGLALDASQRLPHILMNLLVAGCILDLMVVQPAALSRPGGFAATLGLVAIAKLWQRRFPRF